MDEQRVYEPDQLTQAALLEMQQCIEVTIDTVVAAVNFDKTMGL